MEGRLYTDQEIFDALQEATESLYDNDDAVKSILIAKIGADISFEVMQILKFDEQKTIEYCQKKMKEKARDEQED